MADNYSRAIIQGVISSESEIVAERVRGGFQAIVLYDARKTWDRNT